MISRNLKRPVLWLVLLVCAVCNTVANVTGSPFAGAGFALVAVTCAIALVRHHYATRR